ncbi:MAG: hypothetical protein LBF65_00090 [Holosporales bacterium]|nr:hypothetical protein [Holosporales bacterium]
MIDSIKTVEELAKWIMGVDWGNLDSYSLPLPMLQFVLTKLQQMELQFCCRSAQWLCTKLVIDPAQANYLLLIGLIKRAVRTNLQHDTGRTIEMDAIDFVRQEVNNCKDATETSHSSLAKEFWDSCGRDVLAWYLALDVEGYIIALKSGKAYEPPPPPPVSTTPKEVQPCDTLETLLITKPVTTKQQATQYLASPCSLYIFRGAWYLEQNHEHIFALLNQIPTKAPGAKIIILEENPISTREQEFLQEAQLDSKIRPILTVLSPAPIDQVESLLVANVEIQIHGKKHSLIFAPVITSGFNSLMDGIKTAVADKARSKIILVTPESCATSVEIFNNRIKALFERLRMVFPQTSDKPRIFASIKQKGYTRQYDYGEGPKAEWIESPCTSKQDPPHGDPIRIKIPLA